MKLTESFLRREYIRYGKRVGVIAKKARCSSQKVRKELEKFGLIAERDRIYKNKLREILEPRSFGLRTPHIAKLLNENTEKVARVLSKHDEFVNITDRKARASWMLRDNVPERLL